MSYLGMFALVTLGGMMSFMTCALLVANKQSEKEIQTIHHDNCQIHDSYYCVDKSTCKGNPQLCQGSVLK